MISYGHEEHDPERWWIPLIAIDRREQNRGFGRAALLVALDRMRHERPERSQVGLSYLPDNIAADRLYASLGFVKNPELNEKGSVEAWLRLAHEDH